MYSGYEEPKKKLSVWKSSFNSLDSKVNILILLCIIFSIISIAALSIAIIAIAIMKDPLTPIFSTLVVVGESNLTEINSNMINTDFLFGGEIVTPFLDASVAEIDILIVEEINIDIFETTTINSTTLNTNIINVNVIHSNNITTNTLIVNTANITNIITNIINAMNISSDEGHFQSLIVYEFFQIYGFELFLGNLSNRYFIRRCINTTIIGFNDETIIPFNHLLEGTLAGYDDTLNKWTASSAGFYSVDAKIGFALANGTIPGYISLRVNAGSNTFEDTLTITGQDTLFVTFRIYVSTTLHLDIGDIIECFCVSHIETDIDLNLGSGTSLSVIRMA